MAGNRADAGVAALRIAHVSDIHVGAHDDLTLSGLAGDLHAAGAVATIVTGDLTMRARTAEFLRAEQVMSLFPAPTMVVLGNHDIPLTNPLHRMTSPYQRYRRHITTDLDPVLELPGVRVQGLSSMPRWRWKSGRISQRQADLVRNTLGTAPPGTARVVAMHHPPSAAALESLAGRDALEAAMVDAGVNVLLAGHTHVPAVSQLNLRGSGHRVVEVVAGTATSHRTRGVPRSWTLLEFAPGRLTVIEHYAEGSRWQAARPKAYRLPPR